MCACARVCWWVHACVHASGPSALARVCAGECVNVCALAKTLCSNLGLDPMSSFWLGGACSPVVVANASRH